MVGGSFRGCGRAMGVLTVAAQISIASLEDCLAGIAARGCFQPATPGTN